MPRTRRFLPVPDPPRLSADAGLDAITWRPETHWRGIDRQLWRWPVALYAAGQSSRARGHDPGQSGSTQGRKNDDLDAQNAAHAAFAGQRTVTSRSRDGMIESLRVLVACRKTAVAARRVALQMVQSSQSALTLSAPSASDAPSIRSGRHHAGVAAVSADAPTERPRRVGGDQVGLPSAENSRFRKLECRPRPCFLDATYRYRQLPRLLGCSVLMFPVSADIPCHGAHCPARIGVAAPGRNK